MLFRHHEYEQMYTYGMFVCLINEHEHDAELVDLMFEEVEHLGGDLVRVFEDGDEEMYAWLAETFNPENDCTAVRL